MDQSESIKSLQDFMGLSYQVDPKYTAEEWARLRWRAEGWDVADMVAPPNWELVNNDVVS
jgi:hypothetical protein